MTTQNDDFIGVSRFKNMDGTTCYMGSILHVFLNLPYGTDYFLNSGYFKTVKEKCQKEKGDKWKNLFTKTLSYELHRCIGLAHQVDNSAMVMKPSSFREKCAAIDFMWGETRQQDAQEFFSFLLNRLIEESGRVVQYIPGSAAHLIGTKFDKNDNIINNLVELSAISTWQNYYKKEHSFLVELFSGMNHSQLECQVCGHISHSFYPYNTIPIQIPFKNQHDEVSIYDCFDHLVKEEKLDFKNKVECEMCLVKNESTKKLKLWKTPKILVLHISRFHKDMYGNINRKIDNKVNYPVRDLDISKYFSDYKNQKTTAKYDLFSVVLHQPLLSASSINHGHYTAMIKNRMDQKWYLFNDSVKPMEIKDEKLIINKNAYLLFYCKQQ